MRLRFPCLITNVVPWLSRPLHERSLRRAHEHAGLYTFRMCATIVFGTVEDSLNRDRSDGDAGEDVAGLTHGHGLGMALSNK